MPLCGSFVLCLQEVAQQKRAHDVCLGWRGDTGEASQPREGTCECSAAYLPKTGSSPVEPEPLMVLRKEVEVDVYMWIEMQQLGFL